jgi:hypothetical protein
VRRLAVRHAARRALDARRARGVVRRATRVRAPVVVCWDLDNTLVDSGVLIRDGRPVGRAWVEAVPVPGMLAFASALRARLANAAHVVLSVRTREVRAETLAWLEREQFALGADDLWLVASPEDKPAVWHALARNARLVVVDDLTHGHESAEPLAYDRLVEEARRTADVYVGAAEIARVRADPDEADRLARRVADRLGARGDVSAAG